MRGSQPHSIANSSDFIVMGDLTVNRTGAGALTLAASNLNGKVRFEGGNAQTFTSTGSAAALCYKAIVNKSGGSLTLSSELEVNNDVTFTAGVVKTTGSGVLKLRDNATATTASDASHVEGKVLKVGNDAFTYPVGRNGLYRPIAISAPSSTTAEFKAEYFEKSADPIYDLASRDTTLYGISANEYWTLERLSSTNNVSVTVKWDTLTSCSMTSPITDVRVAGWDAGTSKWKDRGNSATTGNMVEGTVTSGAAVSVFTAFTVGHRYSGMGCDGCNSAIELSNIDTTFSVTDSINTEFWYSFTANTDTLLFVAMPGTTSIIGIEIFNFCHDTYPISWMIDVDSIDYQQVAMVDGLIIGKEYWIRVERGITYVDEMVLRGIPIQPFLPCERRGCDLIGNGDFSVHSPTLTISNPYLFGQVACWRCAWGSPLLNTAGGIRARMAAYTQGGVARSEGIRQSLSPQVAANHPYLFNFTYLAEDAPYITSFTAGITGPFAPNCVFNGASTPSGGLSGAIFTYNSGTASFDNQPHVMSELVVSSTALSQVVFFPSASSPPISTPPYYPYLRIDDVSLIDLASAGDDVEACQYTDLVIGCESYADLDFNAAPLNDIEYSWSPSTGLSCSDCPNPTFNLGALGTYTYTLTVTFPSGTGTDTETDQVTVTVVDCCAPTDPNMTWLSNVTLDNTAYSTITDDIFVTGTLTVGPEGMTVQGTGTTPVNVYMGIGAKIEFLPGSFLDADYAIFSAGCNAAWDRMNFQTGTTTPTVLDMRTSKVFDAEHGIVVGNKVDVNLNDNVLSQNGSHLTFNQHVSGTCNVVQNDFTCPSAILPNPSNLRRTEYAIWAIGSNINIGGGAANTNTISDARVGIISIGSQVHSNHNHFQNLVADDSQYGPDLQAFGGSGYGIASWGAWNSSVTSVNDTYENCDNGLHSLWVRWVTVRNSTFTSIKDPAQMPSATTTCTDTRSKGTGVNVTGSPAAASHQVIVLDNTFSDVSNGILVDNTPGGDILINDNHLSISDPDNLLYPGPLRGFGIRVSEAMQNPATRVSIRGNTITDHWAGIHVRNLFGGEVDGESTVTIADNDIRIFVTHWPFDCWAPFYGIRADNNMAIVIANNAVTSVGGPYWTTDGIRSFDTFNKVGINCNELTEVGQGIHLLGENFNSMVGNKMTTNFRGMLYNNAHSGPQGSAAEGHDNEWSQNTWDIGVDGPNFDETLNPFWCQAGSPLTPNAGLILYSNFGNQFIIQQASGPFHNTCPFYSWNITGGGTSSRGDVYRSMLIDSVSMADLRDSTAYWQSCFAAYSMLLDDTAVLAVDSLLAMFTDSMINSSIGLIHRAIKANSDTLASKAVLAAYADSLSTISWGYAAEKNLKGHLSYQIGMRAEGDSISSEEVEGLRVLAVSCPFDSGMAVFHARALLNAVDSLRHHDWINECELTAPSASERVSQSDSFIGSKTNEEKVRVGVYPNPTLSGQLTVEIAGCSDATEGKFNLQIFDMLGVCQYESPISCGMNHLETKSIRTAIYIFRVSGLNGEDIQSGRIAILK